MKRLLGPSVLALGVLSCGPRGGTDVGNGATVTFNLSGYEAKPPTGTQTNQTAPGQQAIVLSSGVHVDEVWVAVERFQLVGGGADCEEGSASSVTYEGPMIANLVDQSAGMSTPVPITPGSYCRLRLELHEVSEGELPPGAPAELAGAAVFIRGTRADGTPFTVRSRQNVRFRLDADEAPIELQGDSPLIVGFELSSVMASLDLPSLTGSPIVIDEDDNIDRLNDLDKAMREAAHLFRDDDDDGTLSPSEAADGKEIADGKL